MSVRYMYIMSRAQSLELSHQMQATGLSKTRFEVHSHVKYQFAIKTPVDQINLVNHLLSEEAFVHRRSHVAVNNSTSRGDWMQVIFQKRYIANDQTNYNLAMHLLVRTYSIQAMSISECCFRSTYLGSQVNYSLMAITLLARASLLSYHRRFITQLQMVKVINYDINII